MKIVHSIWISLLILILVLGTVFVPSIGCQEEDMLSQPNYSPVIFVKLTVQGNRQVGEELLFIMSAPPGWDKRFVFWGDYVNNKMRISTTNDSVWMTFDKPGIYTATGCAFNYGTEATEQAVCDHEKLIIRN